MVKAENGSYGRGRSNCKGIETPEKRVYLWNSMLKVIGGRGVKPGQIIKGLEICAVFRN